MKFNPHNEHLPDSENANEESLADAENYESEVDISEDAEPYGQKLSPISKEAQDRIDAYQRKREKKDKE